MPSLVIMEWIVIVFRFIEIFVYPSLQHKYVIFLRCIILFVNRKVGVAM
jgi:hypothetical protein